MLGIKLAPTQSLIIKTLNEKYMYILKADSCILKNWAKKQTKSPTCLKRATKELDKKRGKC